MRYILILSMFVFVGCDQKSTLSQSADQKVAKQTEQSMQEGNKQVGLPKIKNFREKRLSKEIYEMRDQEGLVTYTYIVDMHGKLHFLGQSMGYGLPYSTQYSNPEKIADSDEAYESSRNWVKLPQAEPNGLFMPVSSSATWVMLKDPDGKIAPQYVEPQIMVFTFKLSSDSTLLAK